MVGSRFRRNRWVVAAVVVTFVSAVPSAPATSAVSGSARPTAGTNLVEPGKLAGRVLSMVETGGRLLVGGEFTGIRAAGSDGGVLDAATGAARAGFPRLNDGHVKAAVADGRGGWYVAGTFTSIEGQPRAGLARLLADGSLSTWQPEVSPPGRVKALALSPGGRVYLGGEFTAVGGAERPGVAAVDDATGAVDPTFDPASGGIVRALALSPDGDRLYAGGLMGAADGGARRGLAALDAAGGPAGWDPDVIGRVDALAVAPDGKVYAGGDFRRAGGAAHGYVARLDPATARADAWDPGADGPVLALALSPDADRVFLGGEFRTLGAGGPAHLGAVEAASGAAVAGWDPGADGTVLSLAAAADGSLLYAGGEFTRLGAAERAGLAAIDPAAGGPAGGWMPDAGGTIETMAVSGALVLAGGRFDRVFERPQQYLAGIGVESGALDRSFAPVADRPVRSLVLTPDATRLYAGGEFTTIGDHPRAGVALLDPTTAAVDPAFVPAAPNGAVKAMALSPDGSRLYVGGAFDSVATPGGAVSRPAHLAALDARTGALLPDWAPPPDRGGAYTGQTGRPTPGVVAAVNTVLVSGDGARVYAGGTFLDIGGRSGLVSLDAGTGQPTAWQPDMARPVHGLAESPVDHRTLYAATGGFGGSVQTFDPSGGTDPVWERRTDGDCMAVAVSAATVYLAGHFDYVCERCGSQGGPGDDFRRHMAAFDAVTGELDPWAPAANTKTGPYTAALGAAAVYIGGEFTKINDLPQPGVALFPGPP